MNGVQVTDDRLFNARVSLDTGKTWIVGPFVSDREAAKAYDQALAYTFHPKHQYNFPEDDYSNERNGTFPYPVPFDIVEYRNQRVSQSIKKSTGLTQVTNLSSVVPQTSGTSSGESDEVPGDVRFISPPLPQVAHTAPLKHVPCPPVSVKQQEMCAYRGVSVSSHEEGFVASIPIGSDHWKIGVYPTAFDAARAYDAACKCLEEPSSSLNLPYDDACDEYVAVVKSAPSWVRTHIQGKDGMKSPYRGVSRIFPDSYQAQVKLKGKVWYLGKFTDETEAAQVYDYAMFVMFGQAATLNFPHIDYTKHPFLLKVPEWVEEQLTCGKRLSPKKKKARQENVLINKMHNEGNPSQDVCSNATIKPTISDYSMVVDRVVQLDTQALFRSPVDPVEWNIPDYNDVITEPMDLGTIQHKIFSGTYTDASQVDKDVRLCFSNAMKYNRPGHFVHQAAVRLLKRYEKEMAKRTKEINSRAVNRPKEPSPAASLSCKTSTQVPHDSWGTQEKSRISHTGGSFEPNLMHFVQLNYGPHTSEVLQMIPTQRKLLESFPVDFLNDCLEYFDQCDTMKIPFSVGTLQNHLLSSALTRVYAPMLAEERKMAENLEKRANRLLSGNKVQAHARKESFVQCFQNHLALVDWCNVSIVEQLYSRFTANAV